MVSIDLDDVLTLAQTVAIIAALLVTLYFSQRQVRASSVDLETRVLNDVDDKFHHIAQMFIERPELIRLVYTRSPTDAQNPSTPVTYYIMFFCAHIFHMRQRRVLADNEWAGWHAWMENAFRYGSLGDQWRRQEMAQWFDPEFRAFVDRELLPLAPGPSPTGRAA